VSFQAVGPVVGEIISTREIALECGSAIPQPVSQRRVLPLGLDLQDGWRDDLRWLKDDLKRTQRELDTKTSTSELSGLLERDVVCAKGR
jgi:hypothetical protein